MASKARIKADTLDMVIREAYEALHALASIGDRHTELQDELVPIINTLHGLMAVAEFDGRRHHEAQDKLNHARTKKASGTDKNAWDGKPARGEVYQQLDKLTASGMDRDDAISAVCSSSGYAESTVRKWLQPSQRKTFDRSSDN